MKLNEVPIITIDGPSGSGKGTVSREVARALGWTLLDSGALYRLVAHAARLKEIDLSDRQLLARVAKSMKVRFGSSESGNARVWLDGQEVTAAIRTEQAGNDASKVAAQPEVRTALLDRQRGFANGSGLVADGRDMGTVVFPEAGLKIFLFASPAERALRRHKQLKEQGVAATLAALSLEIAERDLRDTTRAASPLVASVDAELIDSTGMSVKSVVAHVLNVARERMSI